MGKRIPLDGSLGDLSSEAISRTRAVGRALDLLAVVCETGTITLAEAARRAGVPASTALRLLRTLVDWDFVERDPDGEFRAGPRLLQLGAVALSDEQLNQRAQPHLQELLAETGESAYVSVRGPGNTVLYIGQVESAHSIRHISWVGKTVPLEGTAAGQALSGDVPDQCYAVRRETVEPDVSAAAAPVRGPNGAVLGALSVVGPTFRIDEKKLRGYGRAVALRAATISAELGYGSQDRTG